jgi:hypothetical protein
MPAVGPVAYAAVSDLLGNTGYIRDPSGVNSTILQILLNTSSRFIDEKCGRFFYNDGQYRRFIDGEGSRTLTFWPDFFSKFGTIASCVRGATSLSFTLGPYSPPPVAGDLLILDIGSNYEQVTIATGGVGSPTGNVYPLTLVAGTAFAHPASTIANTTLLQFAFYENQPLSQWLSVQGDGVTGGATNYYFWPTNPKPYLVTGSALQSPWMGINMPLIPVSNTTYLPTPRPGTATIGMTTNWGWPAVPDLIKELCLKMTARAWLSRQDSWAQTSGDSTIGTVDMSHHFDTRDEALLIESGLVRLVV